MFDVFAFPATPDGERHQYQLIVDFWTQFSNSGETGNTTWEILEEFHQKVTHCLTRGPAGLEEAKSLTARAMALMVGEP